MCSSVKLRGVLYEAVNMRDIYAAQETSSQDAVLTAIETAKDKVPPVLFKRILKKIHNREK